MMRVNDVRFRKCIMPPPLLSQFRTVSKNVPGQPLTFSEQFSMIAGAERTHEG
jgi:hypothetical protein